MGYFMRSARVATIGAARFCLRRGSLSALSALIALSLSPTGLVLAEGNAPEKAGYESAAQSSSASAASSASDRKTSCYEAGTKVEEAVKSEAQGEKEEALYRKAFELCPTMAEAPYNLAVLLKKKGSLDAALENLRAALRAREDQNFRIELGNVLSLSGNIEEAEREFRRVLDENPRSPKALQGIALLYASKGENAKALDFLERAKEADELDSVTWFNLAVLYDRANQLEAAVQAFERAAALSPKDGSIQLFLGRTLRRLGETEKSRRALERAADLSPDEPGVQVALGAVYDSQGDPERAERALRRAVESDPKNSTAWANLALVQLDGGRAEDAARSARMAVERAQQDPQSKAGAGKEETLGRAHGILGWALLELGRLGEAEEVISRGAEITETVSSSHTRAASYLTQAALKLRQGKTTEAKERQRTAAEIAPTLQYSHEQGWRAWR